MPQPRHVRCINFIALVAWYSTAPTPKGKTMPAITWAEIKTALEAANPEQLERAASIWLWDGKDNQSGWPHDSGQAVPGVEIGKADDIHETGHSYAVDAIMLVVGPIPGIVLKAVASASATGRDATATATATSDTTAPPLCPECSEKLKRHLQPLIEPKS